MRGLSCVVIMCGLLLSGTARSQTAAAAFYSQSLNCGGIGVRAPAAVDPKALETACKRIDMMLEAGPDIRKRLAAAHAELHIIGQDQPVAEAPEYRSKIGKTGFGSLGEMTGLDARMRGLGGLWSVCGEENLLDPDRYKGGSDICVHVFAHTIMNFGLTESARKRVGLYYAMAIKAQLWKDAYAAADPFEYWAELSMWYFGGHSSQGGEAPKGDGPEALNAYDPYGYSMLYYLYRGKG